MPTVPDRIQTWQMIRPWGKDQGTGKVIEGKIEKREIPVPALKEGEVLVEVAGCGVCHTDLSYFFDGVPTVSTPPLTLGHEISGVVVAGDEGWIGKEVIIPAVMPCGQCHLCKTRKGNRCLFQKMPGNSLGIYGGNASHIPVPSRDLCEVTDRGILPLSHLAVIADAVTTPYQAAQRGALEPGDRVIVIGCAGGVGTHMTQIAQALGASTVIGIDIHPEKLKRALDYGANFVINAADKAPQDIQNEFKELCKENGIEAGYGWKIFEVSGTKGGQDIGLQLLSFTGTLVVVGFGTAKNEYSISRLMAFDAEIIGTWGCLPEYYPIVLDMVLTGTIQLEPFVETRPMSTIREVYDEVHRTGSPDKRIVLTPDF